MNFFFKKEIPANNNFRINFGFLIRFFSFVFLGLLILILSSFKPKTNTQKKYDSPDIKDTIYVYDTVVYYDTTIVYDTFYLPSDNQYKSIFNDSLLKLSGKSKYGKIVMQDSDFLLIKKFKKNKRKKLNLLSLDILFSPVYSFQTFSSDIIYKEASEINNKAVNASMGSNISFNLNFHKENNNFTSGINLTNLRIDFSNISALYDIDTIPKMQFVQRTEPVIDSVKLINIDTLIATGDTVYYYFIDTTYNTFLDTTYIQVADTTESFYNERVKNSYIFFEIPLLYSHSFYTPNFNFSPEIGIITSFFVNSKGKIVSLTDLFQTNNLRNEPKFAFVNLSVYAGIKFNYYITDKFDFITSAYIRRNINSIYKDYPLISRFNSFGINFGFRYKFLF